MYCTSQWIAVLSIFIAPTATATIGSGCPGHFLPAACQTSLCLRAQLKSGNAVNTTQSSLASVVILIVLSKRWSRYETMAAYYSQLTWLLKINRNKIHILFYCYQHIVNNKWAFAVSELLQFCNSLDVLVYLYCVLFSPYVLTYVLANWTIKLCLIVGLID